MKIQQEKAVAGLFLAEKLNGEYLRDHTAANSCPADKKREKA
ncbi:hypothetical protein ATPR_3218 [Acetobacter tropicalis NBRC 101654]|uniref:Uncharacterized protein n=1 Tax=Acetobacter tropicalis NBRC 101654 TaxID=749388 RepID=F7VIL9_9PROT|nr:hypothetical protein ATPR_3218 [Acetobacter tropicalis NBRC 101654]